MDDWLANDDDDDDDGDDDDDDDDELDTKVGPSLCILLHSVPSLDALYPFS